MPVIGVLSARGGTGCSLVATNIAVVYAKQEDTLLIDLNPGNGCDDLLLNLVGKKSWADLLPIANDITSRHLAIACLEHSSSLKVLQSPARFGAILDLNDVISLIPPLKEHFTWLILDLPTGYSKSADRILGVTDIVVLVSTPDPPALRATRALIDESIQIKEKSYLIFNQFSRRHPSKPIDLAEALKIQLIGVLPVDATSVGYQVSLGNVCVDDRRSSFGRALTESCERLSRFANGLHHN